MCFPVSPSVGLDMSNYINIFRNSKLTLALVGGIVLLGAFFIWSRLDVIDQTMRDDLLKRTEIIAQTIDLKPINSMANGEVEILSQSRALIKEQLASARKNLSDCGLIYLVGQRASGDIFFLADSGADPDQDYYPPGFACLFSREKIHSDFESFGLSLKGPTTRRLETVICALAPLRDSKAGTVVAVLGVDINIRDWKKRLVANAFPPASFALLLTVFALSMISNFRSRRKLRESESTYRSLFENMENGFIYSRMIYHADQPRDFVFLKVNHTFQTLAGHRNVAGLKASDLFPEIRETDPEIIEVFGRVALSGQSESLEFFFGALKGWYSISIYSPRPKHFVAFFIDTSERRKTLEALRNSESQIRAMLNATHDSVFLLDLKGSILDLNHQAARRRNKRRKDIIGESIYDYLPEPADANRREAIEKIIQTSSMAVYEEKRGVNTYKIRLFPIFDDTGQMTRIVSFSRDITERKLAEEALRESRENLGRIVELLPDLVAIVQDGTIVFINQAGIKMLGAEYSAQITGKYLTDFVNPELLAEINSGIEALLAGEARSPICTIKIQRLDGRKIDIETVGVPFIYNGQKALQLIARDISGKIKLENQLRQAQKMEAIGTLAGGVSHDFNNLLQAINGYAQMLLYDRNEKDPGYKSIKAIQKAGERAADLVRQLLLFSRKVKIEQKNIQLNHEVEQAQRILERTIPKMIEIEVITEPRLWTINADPIQMEQILLNLGNNAADAMPDGGRLIIKTENMSLDEGYAQNHLDIRPGRYVLLTVTDTGHGMDRATAEHIFEPFYTTKEIGKGTGLGLASVYGIVKEHDGYINCYSEVGQGTVFKIYLPANSRADDNRVKAISAKPLEGGHETILLVDDEESIRDFATEALKKFGYSVLTGASGEEALKVYCSHTARIDLVIMDIGMPGMGGHRCLEKLIQIDPGVKIIIASGYSIDGQVKQALEAGAAGYIGKPYRVDVLLDKVRSVLDESEPA